LRRRGLTPRRVLAPEEPDGQHAEGERAAREDHRLPTGKLLEIADELTRLAMTQIPTEALDLLGATVGVRRQHRLRAFFSQMLAGLAKRLGYARHRSGDVLFADVHSGRDLLRGLLHHRGALPALAPLRRLTFLSGAGDSTSRLLNLVDHAPRHVVGSISHRRCRPTGLVARRRHNVLLTPCQPA
jgi:hypothetical protein